MVKLRVDRIFTIFYRKRKNSVISSAILTRPKFAVSTHRIGLRCLLGIPSHLHFLSGIACPPEFFVVDSTKESAFQELWKAVWSIAMLLFCRNTMGRLSHATLTSSCNPRTFLHFVLFLFCYFLACAICLSSQRNVLWVKWYKIA